MELGRFEGILVAFVNVTQFFRLSDSNLYIPLGISLPLYATKPFKLFCPFRYMCFTMRLRDI